MTPLNRQQRYGRVGEAAARDELAARGYRILAGPYRCRAGEADLVAEDGEFLVFVEVKTRSRLTSGRPRDAVTPRKQRSLAQAALHYCVANDRMDWPLRFDVVEVILLRGQVVEVCVLRDAFQPEGEFGGQ